MYLSATTLTILSQIPIFKNVNPQLIQLNIILTFVIEHFDFYVYFNVRMNVFSGDYPTDRRYERFQQVNVIASIGVLNERKEVNYHSRGWDSGNLLFQGSSIVIYSYITIVY